MIRFFSTSTARRIAYSVISIIIWLYAFFLAFVWFFVRSMPENAVVFRIAASFISDLVWIPAGAVLWTVLLCRLICLAVKKWRAVSIAVSFCTSAAIVVFFPQAAFRLLFLPITYVFFALLYRQARRISFIRGIFFEVPIILIIVLIAAYYRFQLLPAIPSFSDSSDISIMTYNILGNADPESRKSSIGAIRRERPDIVCITEFNPRKDPDIIKRMLGDFYPYSLSNRDSKSWRTGELILSRYPLSALRGKNNGDTNYLFAEIEYGGRTILVASVHLTRVRQNKAVDSLNSFGKKAVMVTEFEKINDGKKYGQAKAIYGAISGFDMPVIVCGDLNDTPNSRVYDLYSRSLTNAFASKGWGIGDTFGEATILKEFGFTRLDFSLARDIIRIDHIFVSAHFDIVSSRVVRNATGSDHKPVFAVLRLKQNPDLH